MNPLQVAQGQSGRVTNKVRSSDALPAPEIFYSHFIFGNVTSSFPSPSVSADHFARCLPPSQVLSLFFLMGEGNYLNFLSFI